VRTNLGRTPINSSGICGCSTTIPFSGGRHTVVISAFNGSGESSSAALVVAPTANAGGPYSGQAGTSLSVSGAGSRAPTGSLVRYTWSWGDGSADTVATSSSAAHTYSSNGTFTVRLTVTDNAGATATATTTATIGSAAAPSSLPAPWLTQDIGSVGRPGSASYSSGRFTVSGAGVNIWDAADSFRYVYQSLGGDGQIVARVATIQNTDPMAKVGIMIRETLSPGSRHVVLDLRPQGATELIRRASTGGTSSFIASTTQPAPAWLRLVRSGDTFVASVSADGVTWANAGSTTVSMSSSVLVGLVVCSAEFAVLNTSALDNVRVTSGSTTTAPATPSSPSPSNGATGISSTVTLTWSAIGATAYDVNFGTTNPPPRVASGSTVASYRPPTLAGSTTYYWQVTARNSAGTRAGAVWSFRTAAQTTTALPSPWLSQDIGNTGIAGNAVYSSGTFRVSGAGANIWGTADAFRFAYRSLTGDGQIVARVTGIGNTSPYAKAGVMIRSGLTAGAAHVILDVRPTGAVEFMTRRSNGGTTAFIADAAQSPPAWLRLVRAGSTVTGYVSRDGSQWNQVGSTSISLPSTTYVGLAVTSAQSGVLNASTFDSVAVTSGGTVPTTASSSSGDIVIYASDVPATGRHGTWQVASDATSPNGIKLTTPDQAAAATSVALASPRDYVDVSFSASAGIPYRVWLRLRARNNAISNDSVWVQFSDALVGGSPIYRMNTTSGLLVNLESSTAGPLGWGWKNGAHWLSQPTAVNFATSGAHTLRIQVREDGVEVDQIVLSPSRYLNSAPGPSSSDATIVPKQ
jgi:PKD repeat protein